MTKIARVRIPITYRTIDVEPLANGAQLSIGELKVSLSPTTATAVADALIDAVERKHQ